MNILKFIFIFLCFDAAAQDVPLKWTAKVGSDFQWMYVSNDGTLIVAKKDTINRKAVIAVDSVIRPADMIECTMLLGIDQKNGTIKWNLKASGLASGADPVPNLPYLQLHDVPLTIIDPSNGRIIINADAERIGPVYSYGFLYESGHLWIDAEVNDGRGLSLFDLSTGKKLWTRYDYFGLPDQTDITVVMGAVHLGTKGGIRQTLLCPPINNTKDYMLIASGDRLDYNDLYKVLIKTGEVVWQRSAPDPVKNDLMKLDSNPATFFRLLGGPQCLYYVGPKSVMACSYDNGKSLWRTPLRTRSKISGVIYDKRGLLFYSASSDADSPYTNGRLTLATDSMGLEVWKDPLNINGGISKYLYTKTGLAVVTENPEFALTPEVEGSYLNFIDVAKGTYKFEDPIRLQGRIRTFTAVPKGLYYSTDRTLNIVDLEGRQLLDIPSRGILQMEDSTKARFYSSHDQNVYELDKRTATKRPINKEKVDFQGTDSPDHMEIMKDGTILYSDQNIMFINSDGSTRYLLHYRKLATDMESATLESLRKAAPPRGVVLNQTQSSNFSFVVFMKNGNESKLSIVSKATGKVSSMIDLPSGSDVPTYIIDADALYLKTDDGIKAYSL